MTDAEASVVISIGSVEAAVRAQETRLETLARGAGGAWRPADPNLWLRHGAPDPVALDGITLRIATLTSHLAQTVRGLERAVDATAPSATVAVSGCAPLGVLRAHILGVSAQDGAALVTRLREVVAPVDGTVVVEHAPVALRAAVDPWGPVDPQAFALMRAIKQQFDPEAILNAGRFVGGL